MIKVVYLMTALFVFTGLLEWLEKRAQRYTEKHPRLNYRKQWM